MPFTRVRLKGCTADTTLPFPQGVCECRLRSTHSLWFLFIHRVNLSPFTKDFRGEEQYNESIDQFFEALPDRRVPVKRKLTTLLIHLFTLVSLLCGRGSQFL